MFLSVPASTSAGCCINRMLKNKHLDVKCIFLMRSNSDTEESNPIADVQLIFSLFPRAALVIEDFQLTYLLRFGFDGNVPTEVRL